MNIAFASEDTALDAVRKAGFSVGTLQRDDPRGLIVGNVTIEKWRNLSCRERKECHGQLLRHGKGGTVTVSLNDHCPKDARKTLAMLAKAGGLKSGENLKAEPTLPAVGSFDVG